MQIIVALILLYAIKSAVEDAQSAWQRSKSGYMGSAAERFPNASRGKRSRQAIRHDAGYFGGQLLHAFPEARHGFARGWHASRAVSADMHAERMQAKTDHLEKRAGLIPVLSEHHHRQQDALAKLRAVGETGEGSSEAAPLMAVARHAVPVAVQTAAGVPPVADEATNGATASPSGSPAGKPSYSWGLGSSPYGWPTNDPAHAHEWARLASRDGRHHIVTEYPPGGGRGKTVATYFKGKQVPPEDNPPVPGQQEPEAKGNNMEYENVAGNTVTGGGRMNISTSDGDLPAGPGPEGNEGNGEGSPGKPLPPLPFMPPAAGGNEAGGTRGNTVAGNTVTGGTFNVAAANGDLSVSQSGQSTATKGNAPMGDVTYDGMIAAMNAARADAEVKQAEAAQAGKNANAMSDQAQALGVDSATLSAMADHLDAHSDAAKAHQRIQETGDNVAALLKRGHEELNEAHQNAPVEAADKSFYAG